MNNNLYQPSGRLKAAIDEPENFGFSCNFYQVKDNLADISAARDWTSMVSSRSGAPSVDLSMLRPKGTPIRRGGESFGVVPFAYSFDAIMYSAVRITTTDTGEILNKNHAGLIGLDVQHRDLKDFLDADFKIASKVVYVTEGQEVSRSTLNVCYNYYKKQPKLFFHKRKANPFSAELPGISGTNLCTEIADMETKDTCVLGSLNLAYYIDLEHLNNNLTEDLIDAASSLIDTDRAIKAAKYDNPLYTNLVNFGSNNYQVGLSLVGFATMLGKCGLTYKTFIGSSLSEIIEDSYVAASQFLRHKYPEYKRVWTQAPTVHSHLRFRNTDGLSVSPSIEPVEGFKIDDKVYCRITSSTHGNRLFEHSGTTPTVQSTPFADYAKVASWFQNTFNLTRLAQGISFSVYEKANEPYTFVDFLNFFAKVEPLKSLYYFIPVAEIDDSVLSAKFDDSPIKITCGFDPTAKMSTDQCECAG